MIKIAARTLDIYDDDACSIARGLPEEYHSLKIAEREEVEALPDRCFGLVMKTANGVRRRFPLHTEDSLKLSEAYFLQVRDSLPPEAASVCEDKIAEVKAWFASDPVDREKLSHAYNGVAYVDLTSLQPAKRASYADFSWGLTINGRNHFPLHDETLVKTAVSRFPFTREGLAPEQAFLYARSIQKRAEALGVDIPDTSAVNLYTSPGLNLSSLAVAIDQRKEASAAAGVDTEVLDQLAFLAGCYQEQGSLEREASHLSRQIKQASIQKLDTERIVGILQTFDKLAGFGRQQYLRGMFDPFAACFKLAAYPSTGTLVDGVDLAVVDPQELASRFDDDFVKEFLENPVAVYKSLPDPVKSVIRGLAESSMGQSPSGRQRQDSASTSVGSTGDPLYRLDPTYVSGIVRTES